MIILDFDGVLFNDERFKRDYWRLFRRAGIPHRIRQDAYEESKKQHRGGYRHDLHLALIQKRIPTFRILGMERDIWKLLKRSNDYLYQDAKTFLRYWKSEGEPLALVSSGNEFQKEKIRASGIARLFFVAIVADTSDKVNPIRTLLKRVRSERIFFIDDRKNVLEAVKQNFPHMTVIQMVRHKKQERSRRADAIVANLAAARRFIEKEHL